MASSDSSPLAAFTSYPHNLKRSLSTNISKSFRFVTVSRNTNSNQKASKPSPARPVTAVPCAKTDSHNIYHRRAKSGNSMLTGSRSDADAMMKSLKSHGFVKGRQPNRSMANGRSERTDEKRQEVRRTEKRYFDGSQQLNTIPSSNQAFIDPEFLAKAFGITLADPPKPKERSGGAEKSQVLDTRPEAVKEDSFSMEVPFQLVRERRPKIQVQIPQQGSQAYQYQQQAIPQERVARSQQAPYTVSPPSTTFQKMENGPATARLSIVSPLSVVEMPKPTRPFSTFSIEDMTASVPQSAPPLSKSANSTSSEDSGEREDRSSCYSAHTSMSSVDSAFAATKASHARRPSAPVYSILSPIDAGVFDNAAARRKMPRMMKSTPSLSGKINRNKPLPPEPSVKNAAPLNGSGQSLSRTGSMRSRSRVPPPLNVNRESSNRPTTPSQPSAKPSAGLKSKYTPKDLDALDDAFKKSMTPKLPIQSQLTLATPNLSQVELALETHLGSIREDNREVVRLAHDPLQISRGPMRMQPSRRAPPPPNQPRSPSLTGSEQRTRPQRRLPNNNTHVALQMKAAENVQRRSSACTGINTASTKADKILGKNCALVPPAPMEREESSDSNWSSSNSPHEYTNSTSPTTSPDGAPTPESEVSSIHDSAFEEVRRRLQLLSTKEDPSETFLAIHEQNAVQPEQEKEAICRPFSATQPALSAASYPAELPIELPVDLAAELPAELPAGLPAELPAHVPQVPSMSPKSQDIPDESHIHPLERRFRSQVPEHERSIRIRSLASLAVSEIPELYASIPSANSSEKLSTKSTTRPSMTAEEVEKLISADAAEQVLLRILQNLDNLQDLFAAATVSKGFYRTFKRHELSLMKNALWGMSPAAWELREMSLPIGPIAPSSPAMKLEYTPSLYLRHYIRDIFTMVELKTMILEHCESFLRDDTITALAGGETHRAPEIDDAFWRVWSFCRIFGCGKGREDDLTGQMDWLRGGVLAKQQLKNLKSCSTDETVEESSVLSHPPHGFGKGNGAGLTAEQLYDMIEIWTCLNVLVRGYHGRREQAREYGIFEKTDIAPGDVKRENDTLGTFNHGFKMSSFLIIYRGMDVLHHDSSSFYHTCNPLSNYTNV